QQVAQTHEPIGRHELALSTILLLTATAYCRGAGSCWLHVDCNGWNSFVQSEAGPVSKKKRSSAIPELAFRGLACTSFGEAWKGVIYRATSPQYANSKDLVSGMGAKKFGGRWNPPGEFTAVYGAVDPETAFAESLAQQRHYGLPVHLVLPMVVAAIDV